MKEEPEAKKSEPPTKKYWKQTVLPAFIVGLILNIVIVNITYLYLYDAHFIIQTVLLLVPAIVASFIYRILRIRIFQVSGDDFGDTVLLSDGVVFSNFILLIVFSFIYVNQNISFNPGEFFSNIGLSILGIIGIIIVFVILFILAAILGFIAALIGGFIARPLVKKPQTL